LFQEWIAARSSGATEVILHSAQLDRIEGILTTMAKEIDDLNAAVGKLVTDIDTVIAAGQAASTELHTQLDAAIAALAAAVANDTADAATIADLQAQLDAIKAAAVEVTNALQAADQKVTDAGANLTPPVTLPPVPDPV
jgi:fructose-1-phosphate kinase PfkB-like protein